MTLDPPFELHLVRPVKREFIRLYSSPKKWHLPDKMGRAAFCEAGLLITDIQAVVKSADFPEPMCEACRNRGRMISGAKHRKDTPVDNV